MSYLHAALWAFRHVTGRYHVPEARMLSACLPDDAICFDVGAHGGLWARALGLAKPRGKVYAFEALPYYAQVLRRTIGFIGPQNVTVLNAAVSDNGGSLQMVDRCHLGHRLTGKSHVAKNPSDTFGTVQVSAITIDDFWNGLGKPNVAFVKCDVEGFELFVLKGAHLLIEACSPLFYNELNQEWCKRYGYHPADIFRFFEERGYIPQYVTAAGHLQHVNVTQHVNRDVLFVPERLRNVLPVSVAPAI